MMERIKVTWPVHLRGKLGVVKERPTAETANVRLDDGTEMVLHTDNFDVQMSRVFANWHGGASYSTPYTDRDLEAFDSIEAAKDALLDRYESGGFRKVFFDYVNKDATDDYVPAVSEDTEMWIWYSDPTHKSDPYPDALIKLHRQEFNNLELVAVVEST